MIPPSFTKAQPAQSSVMTWVLLVILIMGGLGAGGYYFFGWKPAHAKGTLMVNSTPLGAKIAIDGQTQPDWVTPRTFQDLPVGAHRVVVSKDGYVDVDNSVTIEGGQSSSVSPTLTAQVQTPPPTDVAQEPATTTPTEATPPKQEEAKPVEQPRSIPLPSRTTTREVVAKMGTLMISSNPTGAKISIDGKSDPSWITPKTFAEYPAGTHHVILSMAGYEDAVNSVTVEGGKTASLNPTMSVPSGELNILTVPPGLPVTIDGQAAGKTPVHKTLPVGKHTYTISAPGREPLQRTVDVGNGAILKSQFDFGTGAATSTGVVVVRTVPSGASVVVDNQIIEGRTPFSFSLPVGHHKLVFSVPGSGLRPKEQEIDVTPGENTVNVVLK